MTRRVTRMEQHTEEEEPHENQRNQDHSFVIQNTIIEQPQVNALPDVEC